MITKISEYLKHYEKYELLNKSADDIINHVGGDISGFNSKEDAIEEIEYLISADFPDGLNNIPDKVILYRVVLIEDGESINEEKVGEHFISYPNIDRGFLEKIGLWDNWDKDNDKLWLLECETNVDNIDLGRTLGNRLLYPRENEFTLKNEKKIKIINKKEIFKKNISIL